MYIDDITLIPIKEALQQLPQLLGVGEDNAVDMDGDIEVTVN